MAAAEIFRLRLIGIHAVVVPGQAEFPKVTLRFTYDPATKRVAYYDARVGKKALVDKDADAAEDRLRREAPEKGELLFNVTGEFRLDPHGERLASS
jgi:hypothetical protein